MTRAQELKIWINIKRVLLERLSLIEDKADDDVIDGRIRGDVEMRGSNLWILMFAIFVASVGLNVNSTAVIIGAMLISPLMGPIMGIGYGAGINDFILIRRSLKNLGIATLIALLTSTLYFFISPLDTAQSELLSRTTPTLWDVLIGLFGGLAGIVAITRKEKSNVIPGVAIATALMPPICTAGFGLATGHWSYFFGAFYLYTINFVFIAFASFLVVRAFSVSKKKYIDPTTAKRAQRYIAISVLITILPSSYLAYRLVGEEIFKAKASNFITERLNFKNTNVAQVKIDTKEHEIKVFLVGDYISKSRLNDISAKLSDAGLENAKLQVHQNGEVETIDVSHLKADIISDLYKNSQVALDTKERKITELKKQINILTVNNGYYKAIPEELETLFPKVKNVILSQSKTADIADANRSVNLLILNGNSKRHLTKKENQQIETWLKIRIKNDNVKVFIK